VKDVAWFAPDSTSFRGPTPDGERFLVSRAEGLFGAGRYERDNFTVKTLLLRKDPVGAAGIFLGLQQAVEADRSGAELRKTCLAILVRWHGPASQCRLQVKRVHLRRLSSEIWYVHEDELPLVSEAIAPPANRRVLLEVAVREGVIRSIRLDEASIVVPPGIRVAPAPSACGFYADGDDEGGEFVFESFQVSE
jgi:hypothetical protein